MKAVFTVGEKKQREVTVHQQAGGEHVIIDIEPGPRFWIERGVQGKLKGWKLIAHPLGDEEVICLFIPDGTDECHVAYEGEKWPKWDREKS